MLVDTVQLRSQGEKLCADEVRAVVPVRAHLTLTAARPGWYRGQRNAPLLATLWLNDGTHVSEPLDRAVVRQIKAGALLIVGIQQFSRSRRDKDLVVFPQAWWCRIVGDGGQPGGRSTRPRESEETCGA